MRVLYFEPFCGISGDMTLGALVDAGVDLEAVRAGLEGLSVEGYRLSARPVLRAGLRATKVDVVLEAAAGHSVPGHAHRSFADIRRLLQASRLADRVKERSLAAFLRLAVAEGKIHGVPVDDVHFHEVGAVDSIVDIVGSMLALEQLMPARILSGPVNVGRGTVRIAHGTYPVPGPATEELLRGAPTYAGEIEGELTTPTGAALLATLVERFGPRPPLRGSAAGYGAGSRDIAGAPNVLRIVVGDEAGEEGGLAADPTVAVIEATIDDMSPEVYGYFQERALADGALDVFAAPVFMKKNRPALHVTVLAAEADLDRLARLVLIETTTIGVRYTLARRKTLERRTVDVATEYGAVRVKVSTLEGRPVNCAPEFEDCRRLARETGVPLKQIQAAALRAYFAGAPAGE